MFPRYLISILVWPGVIKQICYVQALECGNLLVNTLKLLDPKLTQTNIECHIRSITLDFTAQH